MKKSLLALAVLGAFAGAASAQSSVNISGSIDGGIRRVGTATGHDWQLANSQSGYDNITFRGVEDLGNGMNAFFYMQHRFTLGTGADNGTTNNGSSDAFWRQIWVGVGSNTLGNVRLGRMLVPLQDFNGNFEPFLTGTVGSVHTSGIAATIRATNSVYYRSPSFGGLVLHAMVATADNQNQGNTAPGTTGRAAGGSEGEIGVPGNPQGYFMPLARVGQPAFQNPAGVGARYTAGPIDAAVAYDRNAADMKTFGIYGAYDFGFIRPMFQFEKGDNCISALAVCTTTGNTVATGKEKIKAFSAGLTAPFGAFLLRTGFLRIKSDIKNANGTDRDATKFGFGGDYNLSKRTNLYATVGKWTGDRALGAGSGALGAGTGAGGNAYGAGTNTGARTTANKAMFDIGLTHRF